ncbi:MAG: altronate dehydratase family protein [Synergistaceae bacterium]|jgi:altronate hydrolase|nr:altronate dehydratase family protein [Synergistaceae bacterium]
MSGNCSLTFVRICGHDNVAVLPDGGNAGSVVCGAAIRESVPPLHKIAIAHIREGEPVIKYGVPIGEAICDIAAGSWVHSHNLRQITGSGTIPVPECGAGASDMKFMGFRRSGALRPGIRNCLWVIPLGASVRSEIRYILSIYRKPYWIDSVNLIDYRAPSNGEPNDLSRDIVAGVARSPNAAGVLFAGLDGEYPRPQDICEQAQADGCHALSAVMGQSGCDAIPRLLDDLAATAPRVREEFPASKLCVGLTSGDGISSLTANPLLGFFAGRLGAEGGTVLTAGNPALFRSAAIANRVTSEKIFAKFMAHAARFADNTLLSDFPGRFRDEWKDGVTTPEERALSALPINGGSSVTGFLERAEAAQSKPGVTITPWTGSPPFDCTAFVSAGAQMILFATEHGTPFGSVIPTIKISAVTETAQKHPAWTDFDAGSILRGEPAEHASDTLMAHVLRVACGARTSHEKKGYGEIA